MLHGSSSGIHNTCQITLSYLLLASHATQPFPQSVNCYIIYNCRLTTNTCCTIQISKKKPTQLFMLLSTLNLPCRALMFESTVGLHFLLLVCVACCSCSKCKMHPYCLNVDFSAQAAQCSSHDTARQPHTKTVTTVRHSCEPCRPSVSKNST